MSSVTISQFRKELFRFVESAANGETVEFTHKGMRFRLTLPDGLPVDKLDRVTPLASSVIVGNPAEFIEANRKISEDLVEDWDASWR